MTLPLKHPFTAMIAGPTGCGKSEWVFRLIDNIDAMIEPVPTRIVYCYGEYQDRFRRYAHVEFREGLPNADDFDASRQSLLILDDLMQEADERVANLFTKGSHHRNVSVLLLAQNLFPKNKFARTISLNSHYLVIFKCPRDVTQFANLAKQMYPGNSRFAVDAYKDATALPFTYLFVDLRPEQSDDLRLRTNVFPDDEAPHYVYVARE